VAGLRLVARLQRLGALQVLGGLLDGVGPVLGLGFEALLFLGELLHARFVGVGFHLGLLDHLGKFPRGHLDDLLDGVARLPVGHSDFAALDELLEDCAVVFFGELVLLRARELGGLLDLAVVGDGLQEGLPAPLVFGELPDEVGVASAEVGVVVRSPRREVLVVLDVGFEAGGPGGAVELVVADDHQRHAQHGEGHVHVLVHQAKARDFLFADGDKLALFFVVDLADVFGRFVFLFGAAREGGVSLRF